MPETVHWTDLLLAGGVGLLLLVALWWWSLRGLKQRLASLEQRWQVVAEEPRDENFLVQVAERVIKTREQLRELSDREAQLREQVQGCIQKSASLRFNPFEEVGGDQSFAVALLNAHDTGVIISSLHARAGTRIFVKPIKAGATEHHLSDEERQVLEQALGQTATSA